MDGTATRSTAASSRDRTRQRLMFGALVLVWAGILLGLSGKFLRRCPESDWGVCFVRASLRLEAGEPIYRWENLPYTYPPTMAMLAWPVASLPAPARDVGWYLVNVLASCVALAAAWKLTGGPRLPEASLQWHAVFWLGVVLALRYFIAPLENTQFDMVITAVLLTGCCQLWRGRQSLGGVLLGTAAAMKCTPLLFLPYLLWRRQLRAAAAMAAAVVLWILLPDIVWPAGDGQLHIVSWTHNILEPLSQVAPGGWQGSRIELNQSLSSLIGRWATYGWPLSLEAVADQEALAAQQAGYLHILTYSAAALLLLITAVRLGKPWQSIDAVQAAQPLPLTWHQLRLPIEAAMGVCLMLLLSPMSSKAHYVVLLLPTLLLARWTIQQPSWPNKLLLVALAIAGPLSAKDLIGSDWGKLVLFWGVPTFFPLICLAGLWHLHRMATNWPSSPSTELNTSGEALPAAHYPYARRQRARHHLGNKGPA